MMPLRRFTIHQPKTVAEASHMLAEFGEKFEGAMRSATTG